MTYSSAYGGWGVRGIAILRRRALVLPYLERIFSLPSGFNAARIAPLTPEPLSPLGRGEPRSFNSFTPSGGRGMSLVERKGLC